MSLLLPEINSVHFFSASPSGSDTFKDYTHHTSFTFQHTADWWLEFLQSALRAGFGGITLGLTAGPSGSIQTLLEFDHMPRRTSPVFKGTKTWQQENVWLINWCPPTHHPQSLCYTSWVNIQNVGPFGKHFIIKWGRREAVINIVMTYRWQLFASRSIRHCHIKKRVPHYQSLSLWFFIGTLHRQTSATQMDDLTLQTLSGRRSCPPMATRWRLRLTEHMPERVKGKWKDEKDQEAIERWWAGIRNGWPFSDYSRIKWRIRPLFSEDVLLMRTLFAQQKKSLQSMSYFTWNERTFFISFCWRYWPVASLTLNMKWLNWSSAWHVCTPRVTLMTRPPLQIPCAFFLKDNGSLLFPDSAA